MSVPVLNKNDLKPGDIVGIPRRVIIRWRDFRYPEIIPCTIRRITPARAKFIMEDGQGYDKHTVFYELTDDAKRQSEIARCAQKINHTLSRIDTLHRGNLIFTKNDETLIKICEKLDELMGLLQ